MRMRQTENQKQEIIKEETKIIREIRGIKLANDFTFYKFVSHATANEEPNPIEASREFSKQAASIGFNKLLNEHNELWKQRWEDCDIQIVGDDAAQQALRFSMYHLLAIVPTHTERASIPARGMSGQMYKGAIFWDTEIFMLPFFHTCLPEPGA